jgi:hypothetical protein
LRRVEAKSSWIAPELAPVVLEKRRGVWDQLLGIGLRLKMLGLATIAFTTPAFSQHKDTISKKRWEVIQSGTFDQRRPQQKPPNDGEIAGLFGVGKIRGFTPEAKTGFTPLREVDSLAAVLADTLATLPRDVAQSLANCYWAASLHAVLDADPHFLDTRVTRAGTSARGAPIWRVRLHSTPLLGGRERTLLVEASFPSSHLIAKTPNGLQDLRALRAALYEKAFAQALGGYEQLAWGNSGRALRNMTGNRSAYTFMELANPDRLFRKISRRLEKNRPMVLVAFDIRDWAGRDGDKRKDARAPDEYGIVDQHCYSIAGARTEIVDGKTVKLIELRDPRSPDKTFTKTAEEVQKAFFMMVTNHL